MSKQTARIAGNMVAEAQANFSEDLPHDVRLCLRQLTRAFSDFESAFRQSQGKKP